MKKTIIMLIALTLSSCSYQVGGRLFDSPKGDLEMAQFKQSVVQTFQNIGQRLEALEPKQEEK